MSAGEQLAADASDDVMIRVWRWGDVPSDYWLPENNPGGDEELVIYVPAALVPASMRAMWQEYRERDAADPHGCAAHGEAVLPQFRVSEWLHRLGNDYGGDNWPLLWLGRVFNYQHVFEHPRGGAWIRVEH